MPPPIITLEELVRWPPTIVGSIRWKRSVGQPAGDPCSGFDIRVEEHTATQYRDAGGYIERKPGTGIFKPGPGSVTCRSRADEGDDHVIDFQVTGLHFNMPLDGHYRITPGLKGNWRPSGIFAPLTYRLIDPIHIDIALKKDVPVQSGEFRVHRYGWFSGRRR